VKPGSTDWAGLFQRTAIMNRSSSPEISPPAGAGRLGAGADGLVDPELVALPRPPQNGRIISLALMAVTALFSLVLSAGLFGDVRYALSNSEPDDVGNLASLLPGPAVSNRLVKAEGALEPASAVRYDRLLESGSFEIAPVRGNPKIWVEMRVADDVAKLPPTTTFVGRLVALDSVAFRIRSFWMPTRVALHAGGGNAWVLLDGATPASFRWALALFVLLALFAGYNLAMIARIVRPVR
jgi:hypothetical protein